MAKSQYLRRPKCNFRCSMREREKTNTILTHLKFTELGDNKSEGCLRSSLVLFHFGVLDSKIRVGLRANYNVTILGLVHFSTTRICHVLHGSHCANSDIQHLSRYKIKSTTPKHNRTKIKRKETTQQVLQKEYYTKRHFSAFVPKFSKRPVGFSSSSHNLNIKLSSNFLLATIRKETNELENNK